MYRPKIFEYVTELDAYKHPKIDSNNNMDDKEQKDKIKSIILSLRYHVSDSVDK